MECVWCGKDQIEESKQDCYWVLPDGKRSVQIRQIPAVHCESCGLYITEEMNQKVEELLYLSELSQLPDTFTYEELVNAPKIQLFKIK
ncbi:YokU family protein [Lihuaxuella thermophila]|uniref:Uncharacterized protein, YokU family n=1 Tax=Lihuaxuella thermophila TaxID=1173111 RepID=A0A1H8ILY0_9BACL|nr:YokU family protein [Lihuaxuella thermophila]SEN69379.1 uncharacterized protein, YokU family [Lihuaxuella thermophila]